MNAARFRRRWQTPLRGAYFMSFMRRKRTAIGRSKITRIVTMAYVLLYKASSGHDPDIFHYIRCLSRMQSIKAFSGMKKPANEFAGFFYKRRGWDSNPRALARKLISSQPRYDRFDTPPQRSCRAKWLKNRQIALYTLARKKSTFLPKFCGGGARPLRACARKRIIPV